MTQLAFERWGLGALAILILAACGSSSGSSNASGGAAGSGATGATGTGGVSSGSGGSGLSTGSGGSPIVPIPDAGTPDETLCGDVQLTANRTIAAGTTVAICAGATITASAGVTLTVEGTLLSQGTATSPVTLKGATTSSSGWAGLVVADGGAAVISYTEIRDASMALTTRAGAAYSIDHLVIDNSAHLADIRSSGTISHGVWHALGAQQSGVVMQITDASPEITDTLIDNSNQNTDMIHVQGTSSAPVFDHTDISNAHCSLHFAQGTNCTIRNSNLHDVQYGLMVLASKGTSITHNNFQSNVHNIGSCGGGTATITGNYFEGAPFDGSCSSLSSTGDATAAFTDVGVRQ